MTSMQPLLVTIGGRRPLSDPSRLQDHSNGITAIPGLHLDLPPPTSARSPFSVGEDAVNTAVTSIMDHLERSSPCVPVQVGLILAFNAASVSESYFASLVLSSLRDTLPKSCLIACPLNSIPPSPHSSPLSPYAAVLAHATAMEHADAIVMAASEDLLGRAVDHVFPRPTPLTKNAKTLDGSANGQRPMLLFDLVTACCPVPELKYLNIAMSKPQRVHPGAQPDANVAVATLIDSLRSVPDVRPCTLAATLHASLPIVNDNPTWSWSSASGKLATKLRFTPASFDRESSHGPPLYCRTVTHELGGRSKMFPDLRNPSHAPHAPSAQLSLVYNSASVAISDLSHMAVAATRKAHTGAFLHHLPSNIGDEWIPDACEAVWACVDGYRGRRVQICTLRFS